MDQEEHESSGDDIAASADVKENPVCFIVFEGYPPTYRACFHGFVLC